MIKTAVIFAGGYGTRISDEPYFTPKPMNRIGGKPILWHIMKIYSHYKINNFIICLGYKGYVIKEYFSNYFLHTSDVTFDIKRNKIKVQEKHAEPWTVTLVDTGEDTMTGGRLKRIQHYINEPEFCLTYGDGLSNVNIKKLIEFHQQQNKLLTITATQPPGRFGALHFKDNELIGFQEKPEGDGAWINGGFFVASKKVIDHIENDQTEWERDVIQHLVSQNNVAAFKHRGFWHPMDTLRDKKYLENLWQSEGAPWKVWE